jgi:hypothetical protein
MIRDFRANLKQVVKDCFTCDSCGGAFDQRFKLLILLRLYQSQVP